MEYLFQCVNGAVNLGRGHCFLSIGVFRYFPGCKHSIATIYLFLDICYFFPGRQALPCRGNWVSEEKSEFDLHYHQLMFLRAEDDPSAADWMEKRQFMSPSIQI